MLRHAPDKYEELHLSQQINVARDKRLYILSIGDVYEKWRANRNVINWYLPCDRACNLPLCSSTSGTCDNGAAQLDAASNTVTKASSPAATPSPTSSVDAPHREYVNQANNNAVSYAEVGASQPPTVCLLLPLIGCRQIVARVFTSCSRRV